MSPCKPARLAGFVLIWAALLVYSLEGWWHAARQAPQLWRQAADAVATGKHGGDGDRLYLKYWVP